MSGTIKTIAVAAWLIALPTLCAANPGDAQQPGQQEFAIGRNLTRFASTPRFGGYAIGKYDYTDHPALATTNGGFALRQARLHADGTVLGDFAYHVGIEVGRDCHMKDYYLEWQRYDELKVRVGQFKRAFGMENMMDTWDVGTGDRSQVTKMLAGHGDYIIAEAANNAGRDQGAQIEGDLFPVGNSRYRLVHYQLMFANGQGINTPDANSNKDFLGTLYIQPVPGLYIGASAWTGDFTDTRLGSKYYGKSVNRDRYMASVRYDGGGWTFRAEYAYSQGRAFSLVDNTKADGWYATLGVPCAKWLKVYGKYDVYRPTADMSRAKTIYTIAPNIQLHKNLMLQLQYNFTHDRTLTGTRHDYNEVWAETYVRF